MNQDLKKTNGPSKLGWIVPLVFLALILVMAFGWGWFYTSRKALLAEVTSPEITVERLKKLGRSSSTEIKVLVAHHPKTPEKVLRRIAQDKALRVWFAQDSRSRPALLQVVTEMSSRDPSVLAYVGAHAHATEAILNALSGHPDPQVRLSVAGNEVASEAILKELTGDVSQEVQGRARKTLEGNRGSVKETKGAG